ncbi:MAG TPA: hypothetical protein VHW06_21355 [Streptosporangiaceae bacterium]|jgi:isoaspartyl peptidase/L-asparaginase-like protein (Ntn-hydrolase superfamily)|nr:hypothetical protein [Streptosporangiaceae bacterium]
MKILTQLFELALPGGGLSVALHGGAGDRTEPLPATQRAGYEQGLRAAYQAGWRVLAAGSAT